MRFTSRFLASSSTSRGSIDARVWTLCNTNEPRTSRGMKRGKISAVRPLCLALVELRRRLLNNCSIHGVAVHTGRTVSSCQLVSIKIIQRAGNGIIIRGGTIEGWKFNFVGEIEIRWSVFGSGLVGTFCDEGNEILFL